MTKTSRRCQLYYQIVRIYNTKYFHSVKEGCDFRYRQQMCFLSTHHIKYTKYLLLEFCISNITCHGNFAHGKFYSITQRSYKEENMAKDKEVSELPC